VGTLPYTRQGNSRWRCRKYVHTDLNRKFQLDCVGRRSSIFLLREGTMPICGVSLKHAASMCSKQRGIGPARIVPACKSSDINVELWQRASSPDNSLWCGRQSLCKWCTVAYILVGVRVQDEAHMGYVCNVPKPKKKVLKWYV
jgi:hypothetical protein